MTRYTVEVTYEFRQTYVVVGDSQEGAEEHAVLLAKEELGELVEVGISSSEFETYVG